MDVALTWLVVLLFVHFVLGGCCYSSNEHSKAITDDMFEATCFDDVFVCLSTRCAFDVLRCLLVYLTLRAGVQTAAIADTDDAKCPPITALRQRHGL